MSCTELCKALSFGNLTPIKDAKFCLPCGIFLLTESEKCACCGSVIDYWAEAEKKQTRFKYYPSFMKNKKI
jgi:hypothetical protein